MTAQPPEDLRELSRARGTPASLPEARLGGLRAGRELDLRPEVALSAGPCLFPALGAQGAKQGTVLPGAAASGPLPPNRPSGPVT